MQFNKSKKVGAGLAKSNFMKKKVSMLDMYESCDEFLPEFCDIEELYRAAYNRLQVIQTIEEISSKLPRNSPEFEPQLMTALRGKGLKSWISNSNSMDPEEAFHMKKIDFISHFTLRLTYCQNEELRRWFTQWETELFRIRLERESTDAVKAFEDQWQLDFDTVSSDEKDEVLHHVIASRSNLVASVVNALVLYKVHFSMVPDMVGRRRVYVRKGMAYLLPDDTKGIIVAEFRSYLSKVLTKMSACANLYLKDDQIAPLMKLLARRQINNERTFREEGSVTPAELDQLSKDAFPMCMTMLHERLRDKHHLKHTGRLMYTLFLKGIGLSMEDSLKFFGQEFSKSVGPEKFSKEYAYAVRHSYGKEGKRADYRPYNCMKVISLHNPTGVECHGCPYKTLESDVLKNRLRSSGVPAGTINDVMSDVKNYNYAGACSKVFEARSKLVLNTTIVHPNQYYEESLKVLQGTSQLVSQDNKIDRTIVKTYTKPKTEERAESPDFDELVDSMTA